MLSLSIGIQMDRGVLTVNGKDVQVVLDEFREIVKWASEIGVDLTADVKFYESIIEAQLNVGKENNPIETSRNMFAKYEQYRKFSEIFGSDITNYGVRLVNAGTSPSSDTWIDLRIDPSVERSNSIYRVNGVLRGPDLDNQMDAAQRIEEKVKQIVITMQEGA